MGTWQTRQAGYVNVKHERRYVAALYATQGVEDAMDCTGLARWSCVDVVVRGNVLCKQDYKSLPLPLLFKNYCLMAN